jgi:hypothetical protein
MRSPVEALTQVVFVHDYVQLVFEDERLSVYNMATVSVRGGILRTGAPRFAEALVALIGQRAEVIASPFSLRFSNGATFTISFAPEDVRGPEAFTFVGKGGLMVADQNAV